MSKSTVKYDQASEGYIDLFNATRFQRAVAPGQAGMMAQAAGANNSGVQSYNGGQQSNGSVRTIG